MARNATPPDWAVADGRSGSLVATMPRNRELRYALQRSVSACVMNASRCRMSIDKRGIAPQPEPMSTNDIPAGDEPGLQSAEVVDLRVARARRSSHPGPKPDDAKGSPSLPQVRFDRRELDQLLRVYGRKVAEGEWRDYAIDFGHERATFSCFRRTSEMPQFRVVKDPRHAKRQGAWQVLSPNGQVLKRGHDLAAVLRLFDRKPRLVN